jgi:predicted helicase
VKKTFYLQTQLQNIARMSGPEFERYMGSVFEALGYKATILGGAGDQGVDLLLQKENECIAVQCKNYQQPVGNKPIQEVYAGARHHAAHHAWVVAPAGYTKWAEQLARSTGVALYARVHIEKWVEQARIQQRIDSLQKAMDREDYKTLLTLYSETLDNLKYRLDTERQYAFKMTYNASIREQYEQTRRTLYRYIDE